MLPFSHKTSEKYGILLEARNLNLNAPPFFNLIAESVSEPQNASTQTKSQEPDFERRFYELEQLCDEVRGEMLRVLRSVW